MNKIKNHHPKQRFSHTVEYYVKYRPHYPKEAIAILKKQCDLNRETVVADIGSGTGIFTKLLLENNDTVFGIEPNAEMRQAAEKYLSDDKNFVSVAGSAENTTLKTQSIDIITAAQAFHWFDQTNVKQEFKRILKPQGWVVLLWNLRDSEQPGFMQAYEKLLQTFGTDYQQVYAEGLTEETVQAFFAPHKAKIFILPNEQTLDWEGFKGRLLSTSYVPKPDAENFTAMLDAAEKIFNQHQQSGKIKFIYETKLYLGQI